MVEHQNVKGRVLGVTTDVGGYVLALDFPAMGASTLYVPSGYLLEAIQKGDAHLIATNYGAHPVSDEVGLWFNAEPSAAGCRAVEFDVVSGVGGNTVSTRVRVERCPGAAPDDDEVWSIDLLPPAETVVCDRYDEDLYHPGRRARAPMGAVVRDKVTGRYGSIVGWADGNSDGWLIIFESSPVWPDGSGEDVVRRKRDKFCLVGPLDRDQYERRLDRRTSSAVSRMLRQRFVMPNNRGGS
jgi:hypothetical protein